MTRISHHPCPRLLFRQATFGRPYQKKQKIRAKLMASLLPTGTILALLLFIGSFLIVVIDAKGGGGGGRVADLVSKSGQREFDYFALALQWPGTFCRKTRHCCSSNACCRGSNSPATFTIHGLWPDYNDGTWPSCCTAKHFDVKEIATLRKGLEQYWPSLSCGSPSTCHGTKGVFWAHEWEKHGTCSSPVFGDEYTYFLATLNLYFKYNVTEVLFEAGYVPSNSEKYPVGGIITAIQNAFHTTPQLVCTKDAIEEIRLCFYKDFKFRDCVNGSASNGRVSSRGSCPKYVSLPEYTSLGLNGAGTADSSSPLDAAY